MFFHPVLCHLGHHQHIIVGVSQVLSLPARFPQFQVNYSGVSGLQMERIRVVESGTGLTPLNLLFVGLVVYSWHFFLFLQYWVFIWMLRMVSVRYIIDV